jgi:hypothetical protein
MLSGLRGAASLLPLLAIVLGVVIPMFLGVRTARMRGAAVPRPAITEQEWR